MPKGGGQKRGGGQNLTRRPPTENSFRPPSPRYVLPPPYSISLSKSLRNCPEFPSADLLRNSFRRVSKNGFRRAILARFCFSVRFAPTPLALPSINVKTKPSNYRESAWTSPSPICSQTEKHVLCIWHPPFPKPKD